MNQNLEISSIKKKNGTCSIENCEKTDQSKTFTTNNSTQVVNGDVSNTDRLPAKAVAANESPDAISGDDLPETTLNRSGDEMKADNMAKVGKMVGNMYIGATQHDGHQATANATNGNALTIGRDNPGTMANNVTMRDKIDNQTINNYGSCLPLSENAKKEKVQKMVDDLAAKLEIELEVYKNSAKKNRLHDVKVQIVPGNMQHWNYCKSKMDRQKISEKMISQSKNGVETTGILNSTNNDIVIIGPPMVGKTNFVRTLDKSFLNEKSKFVFFVDFKCLKDVQNIDFLQFLTNNRKKSKYMENKNDRTNIIDYLVKTQENILVVLDHLELMNLNQCENLQKFSYFDIGPPINFFLGIISGLIFGESKKLFVSRPCNLEWMYRFQKFEFYPDVYNVLYTKKNILDAYLNQLSEDKKDLIRDTSVICEDIWSFCSMPCIFKLFLEGFDEYNLSATLSFAYAFLHFYVDLVDKKRDIFFEELVNFAWCQFYTKDNLCIEINPEELSSALYESLFVTLPVKFKFRVNKNLHKSHMLHILIHEFLIALKVFSLNEEEFNNFIDNSENERNYYFLNNFICDFCSEKLSCVLKYLPESFKKCLESKFFVNIETHKKSLLPKLQSFREQFRRNAYQAIE